MQAGEIILPRLLLRSARADQVADDHEARSDAHTRPQGRVGLQSTHSRDQLQPRAHGALCVVLMSLGITEINQDPVVTDWPLILIDLFTNEGVVGRSYLEPYTTKAMKYLIPALHDFGEMLEGRELAPVELYELARKSLHFVGYQGLSMTAVSGLDLAAWDARAKAANVPLCVFLGGSVGPVKAYNSNGLWLKEPSAVAAESIELRDEGGFTGLKLRLGRDRLRDDLAAIEAGAECGRR
jgi:mandelate racemase